MITNRVSFRIRDTIVDKAGRDMNYTHDHLDFKFRFVFHYMFNRTTI